MEDRPRIAVNVKIDAKDNREVELWLNPAARTKLIEQLQRMDRTNEHFHLFDWEEWDELTLSNIPYNKDDKLACHFKVMLRYDDWDQEHFPHVMASPKADD